MANQRGHSLLIIIVLVVAASPLRGQSVGVGRTFLEAHLNAQYNAALREQWRQAGAALGTYTGSKIQIFAALEAVRGEYWNKAAAGGDVTEAEKRARQGAKKSFKRNTEAYWISGGFSCVTYSSFGELSLCVSCSSHRELSPTTS